MQVVVNRCYGGFGLSPVAIQAYLSRKGKTAYFYKAEFVNSRPRYEKVDTPSEDDIMIYAVTKDFGVRPSDIEDFFDLYKVQRNDPDLISVVKELGPSANTRFSALEVVEIPNDVEWEIEEYDGQEWVSEQHRTW